MSHLSCLYQFVYYFWRAELRTRHKAAQAEYHQVQEQMQHWQGERQQLQQQQQQRWG